MNLADISSLTIPFTPLLIKDGCFDFDVSSDSAPDDNNTLTPLLRRITATPKLLTPKQMLLSPTVSPANTSTTPTIINGQLAPPQLQQYYSKTPQRRGSPLAGFRRLRSPRTSPDMHHLSTNIGGPVSPANVATTATIINGRLAPPRLQQHYSKTPQRRGSPLAGLRRLRSPGTSPEMRHPSTFLDVPTQINFVAGNKNKRCNRKDGSKGDMKSSNLAARRRCRQLRLKELQRRYAEPFEIHALPKPLSPRVGYLLRRVGMIRYKSIFQMEEVDFLVFCTLNKNDLQVLGIGNAEDREEIYRAVLMADVLIRERF